jgi:hypothetical protein
MYVTIYKVGMRVFETHMIKNTLPSLMNRRINGVGRNPSAFIERMKRTIIAVKKNTSPSIFGQYHRKERKQKTAKRENKLTG